MCAFKLALVDAGIDCGVYGSVGVVVGGDVVQKLVQEASFKNWTVHQYNRTVVVQNKSNLFTEDYFHKHTNITTIYKKY